MGENRIVTLSDEQAAYAESLVEAGRFASIGEVLDAGLQLLELHEGDIDRWVEEEVLPVVDLMEADPGRGIPIDEVFAEYRHRHATGTKPFGR